jgi:nitroreductase
VVAWDERVDSHVAAAREVKLQPGGAVTFGDAVMLSQTGPATYPVLAATNRGLVAAWATGGDASRIDVRRFRLP